MSPSGPPDDEMSSGSPGERSTSGDYSISHTRLPTELPPPDRDSPWVSSKPESTSDTSKEHAFTGMSLVCLRDVNLCAWRLPLEGGDLIWGSGLLQLSVCYITACYRFQKKNCFFSPISKKYRTGNFSEECSLFSCPREMVTVET